MSAAGITQAIPGGQLDQATRLLAAISKANGRVRRHFLRIVHGTRAIQDLEGIAALLASGRVDSALNLLTGEIGESLATAVDQAYIAAGLSAAEVLRSQVDTLLEFNLANNRAVSFLQETRLRLVAEFGVEQRLAAQVFLEDAFAAGLAPIEQARVLQRSVGLTRHQARIVQNYRRNLTQLDRRALGRALRDKRFDSTVLRAIESGRDLTAAQIDRMVERYEQRWVAFRAKTIAETESVAAASAADEELWRQAIESDVLPAEALTNTWRTSGRETRRPSHRVMEGQVRPFGVPFDSGDGNKLRFPGDPRAPGSDTINCQCVIARKVNQKAAAAHRELRAA